MQEIKRTKQTNKQTKTIDIQSLKKIKNKKSKKKKSKTETRNKKENKKDWIFFRNPRSETKGRVLCTDLEERRWSETAVRAKRLSIR